MATGTIIMIVCLILLALVRFFFKKDQGEIGENHSTDKDKNLKGLDGCGIIGYSIDDLNKELYDEK